MGACPHWCSNDETNPAQSLVGVRGESTGFFAKWDEGRIDDPNGGWKGRALRATNSTRTVFHNEGGKESRPNVVRFQMRPDPLAR